MTAFNVLTETRHGQMLCNRNDQYVGKSLIEYGEFSPDECSYLLSLLKADDVVVEVGANIGALTVPIAQRVKRVIAYEPQRIPFQTLCANIALNSLANVFANRMAVGATDGVCQIPDLNPNEPHNFGGVEMGRGAALVDVVRLRGECTFIKLDCEGMEYDALHGARKLIRQYRPRMYIENDRPAMSERLIGYVEQLGYTWEWHRPPLFSADNFKQNPKNHFGDIVSINMICTPK